MSYEVVPFTDRADWLAKRRQGIGASDIAGIMGISPYTTPFQVWASKVHAMPDDNDDEGMLWGRIMEDVILDQWSRETAPGEIVRQPFCRNIEQPHFMATPDAITPYQSVVEVKTTSDWSWSEIPQHYYLQIQWQIIVTGAPFGELLVLHNGRHLEPHEIKPDSDMQAEMTGAANDFWKLVEANEAPPVEADDYTIMQSLWPRTVESPIEIPWDLAAELYDAKDDRDEGKDRYEKAAAAVKEIMRDDADTAIVDQQVVATWKGEPRRFVVKGEGLE